MCRRISKTTPGNTRDSLGFSEEANSPDLFDEIRAMQRFCPTSRSKSCPALSRSGGSALQERSNDQPDSNSKGKCDISTTCSRAIRSDDFLRGPEDGPIPRVRATTVLCLRAEALDPSRLVQSVPLTVGMHIPDIILGIQENIACQHLAVLRFHFRQAVLHISEVLD